MSANSTYLTTTCTDGVATTTTSTTTVHGQRQHRIDIFRHAQHYVRNKGRVSLKRPSAGESAGLGGGGGRGGGGEERPPAPEEGVDVREGGEVGGVVAVERRGEAFSVAAELIAEDVEDVLAGRRLEAVQIERWFLRANRVLVLRANSS